MMKEKIKQYVIREFGADKIDEVLRENRLHLLYVDNAHNTKYLLNKANTMLLEKELLNVCRLFDGENIPYITFKGVVLGNRLYKDKYKRVFGDMDVYVSPLRFEEALNLLFNNGYSLRNQDSLQNVHHVVLTKGRIVLELHRHILNPFTQIDESYMYNHTEELQLSGQKIKTLDVTATFLHLLYHLYMDTWLKPTDLFSLLTTTKIAKADRFLFRAYEIALFSEQYSFAIDWDEIIWDIKKQQLRILFKKLIHDILEIFPEALSKQFINTVDCLRYIEGDRIVLRKHRVETNLLTEQVGSALARVIDAQWNANAKENICIYRSGTFVLNNMIVRDVETLDTNWCLTCAVSVEKIGKTVRIEFKIANDDFCFSNTADFNTQTSDGVHLMICGTEQYSYNSIFLFPKIIGGEPVVVPVDVLNDVNREIDTHYISAVYSATEQEYTLAVVLKEAFLRANHLDNYFYLGLVISDCSSKTQRRKSELILTNPDGEWFNPIYFAKIQL